MTSAKTTDVDYTHISIAEFYTFGCHESKRCSKYSSQSPIMIHFTAFLTRIPQHTEALWKDVSSFLSLTMGGGYLIIDDSTPDKPHARAMHLIGIHWSENHHKMVQGISLVTLVWTNGVVTYLVDFRIYQG
jgi:hypothetical protein